MDSYGVRHIAPTDCGSKMVGCMRYPSCAQKFCGERKCTRGSCLAFWVQILTLRYIYDKMNGNYSFYSTSKKCGAAAEQGVPCEVGKFAIPKKMRFKFLSGVNRGIPK